MLPEEPFAHLLPGRRYRIVQPFTDYDGREHAIGEAWEFVGSSFLPYDDGLSLFVRDGDAIRHIRMQWRAEEQGPVIDALSDYIQPA